MVERPLLILDLDETLLWATPDEPDVPYDFRVFGYYATKRPHLTTFLEKAFSWFDMAVWTSSGGDYARVVVAEVFDDPSKLLFVWDSSRCTQRRNPYNGEYYSVKDLKKVKRNGYSLDRVPERVNKFETPAFGI